MGLELLTPPAIEPVSLDQAKAHLRVDTTDEDALIERLVATAREFAERHTGRAFILQSWMMRCDAWPNGGARALELPKPPLIDVISVVAYDRSGAATALSDDRYIVDSAAVPGRIVLKMGTVLPSPLREANAIAVQFEAGFGSAADEVPSAIRSAILQITAQLFENRGDGDVMPPAQALALLSPYRMVKL